MLASVPWMIFLLIIRNIFISTMFGQTLKRLMAYNDKHLIIRGLGLIVGRILQSRWVACSGWKKNRDYRIWMEVMILFLKGFN